ncbi:MAG: OsmC family protein [Candidatus Kapabacteria bacterium]|nr:OsmC family protein [Candidatus Kapabacteria bacterium]
MSTHNIKTEWNGKMKFTANVNGFPVTMDTTEKGGGDNSAPSPKPFVLTALSGCTGMDVISMLQKGRKEPKSLSISVEGEVTETHPKQYEKVHIIYDFQAEDDHSEAIIRAVRLSQEQYCGVSAMMQKAMPVTWTINLNGTQIFTNN